jgi:hypothetical protein
VFYDLYSGLDPGCAIVAENTETGRLMGSCFYHPRPHHVSLGIMNAHPNYFGCGVANALLRYITDFAEEQEKPVHLVQSALNLDSYSLYTRAGFVPRCAYQDMMFQVPSGGMKVTAGGLEVVREATPEDVPGMAALELEVSGITREQDYRYCLRNDLGFFHTSVCEGPNGRIDGFMISSSYPALNWLGPGVARTEAGAAALILRELDLFRGRAPIVLIPVEREQLVRQMYDWGGRNCELHFGQVRGAFRPFQGINMPSILPETA